LKHSRTTVRVCDLDLLLIGDRIYVVQFSDWTSLSKRDIDTVFVRVSTGRLA